MRKSVVLASLLAFAAIWITFRPTASLQAQPAARAPMPTAWDASATRIVLRYGVTDTEAGSWKGRIEAASGSARVIAVEGLHFTQGDRAASDGAFSFATRSWAPGNQQVDLSPVLPGPRAVFPNGIYAVVTGPPDARLKVSGAGDFSFSLTELAGGRQLAFNNGNIQVELAPNPATLSSGAGEADFPSIARSAQGVVSIAWQEFTGERDRIVVRDLSDGKWSQPEVWETGETADVFRPAAVYDTAGTLHVIWPAQVDGNWDLYSRRRSSSGWSAIERVTQNPGSDFHQKVVADQQGNLWLAWQAFRNGQSDVYVKEYRNGAWGAELRISESSANDWEPSLAAAGDGTVWVGWDTYDKGDYDVMVRPIRNGQPGRARAITKSTRFEAHASLACDKQNRLWIAFDESTANWGKDYGYLEKTKGNPLYISRRVGVVRLDGERLEEPTADIAAAFPLYVSRFLEHPRISVNPDGSLTLAALQLTKSNSVVEVWGAAGIWENVVLQLDAAGWHRAQVLPYSNGANDERVSIVGGGSGVADGSLWAAWASDDRDFGNARMRHQNVFAAAIPRLASTGEITLKPFVEAPELSEPTHPHEAADLKTIRGYRIQSGEASYRIMRGDLHRHTALSADGVGDGSLWDFYRYVLDAVNLDFSTVTDHQAGGTSYNWWKIQKSCDLFLTPTRLTPVYAYERSVLYPNGHRNIVFTKRGVPVLPIDPLENRGPDSAETKRSSDAVWPYLRKYNAIAFRHTTATDQGTDWKDHDNTLEPLVEVYQGHRLVYEHEGGPKGMTADRLYTHRSGYRPAGYIWNALAKGYRLGFEAASDHCSTHISYSCILTRGESREDIVDAMRKRHSYGATDNIVLDFRVSAEGKEYLQGDEVPHNTNYVLRVNVVGTGAIGRVALIHNESYAYWAQGNGKREMQFTYTDPHPAMGENRYYVRVEQEDGNLAWSSPVWILAQ